MAIEFVKNNKQLYNPPAEPGLIQVPSMRFSAIKGSGAPEGAEYQNAVGALYTFAYSVKMSKMSGDTPPGYEDFKVPPLEGLWACGEGEEQQNRGDWQWISLLRIPNYVTPEVFEAFRAKAAAKKPELDFSGLYLWDFEEGLCVQMMHLGPYATEQTSFDAMQAFINENNVLDARGQNGHHHEIYLNDPRRLKDQSKLKTVLRLPVVKI